MDEQLYTLAEAEVILSVRMRQKMCLDGAGAPGHLIQEFINRNAEGYIMMWELGCNRCGCRFQPSWPE